MGDQTRRPPDPISIGSFDSLPAARKEPQGDTLVGREFDGRYLSEKPIGRGGMGNVYRAMQKAFGRPVALKILRPELIKSSRAVKRFERESRIIMKLEHPNSIRLYDFGQAETGELFIAMELLAGKSLKSALDGGCRFSTDESLRIVLQVLKALVEAHGKGIIHRDLKPGNLFLTEFCGEMDTIFICDFFAFRQEVQASVVFPS